MTKHRQLKARARSELAGDHISGYPREHYNWDRSTKVQYKTEEKAQEAANIMMRHYPDDRLEVYRCPYCGCWHIGHEMPEGSDEKQIHLGQLIRAEMQLHRSYQNELRGIAGHVLDLESRMEALEATIWNHYYEFQLYKQNNKKQKQ